MTNRERNDFPNLMYLCTLHHRAVDANNGEDYPVTTLMQWKANAESGSPELHAAPDQPVTADVLEEAIASAMENRDRQIEETLERLKTRDEEAAALMQELLDELKDARRAGSVVDPDVASTLHEAATKLAGLEDIASTMLEAAKRVQTLKQFM